VLARIWHAWLRESPAWPGSFLRRLKSQMGLHAEAAAQAGGIVMGNLRSLLAIVLPATAILGVAACTSGPGVSSRTASPPAASPAPSQAISASHSSTTPVAGGPVPPCTITQLKITLTRRGGAVTGWVGGYLRFANAGHAACQLHGWPEVTAVTASGQEITALRAVHGTMLGSWQRTSPLPVVRLTPGAAAFAVLAAGDISPGTGGRCPTVRVLRVAPPASSGHVRLSARLYDHVYLPACTSVSGSTEIEFSAAVPLRDLAH
ncbi:MAG: DUF4232 domain-containing protein, partial [Actinobacteria bacterium]|nr:DUF4232 domain-containing protein [Actinomycetota bacterium]